MSPCQLKLVDVFYLSTIVATLLYGGETWAVK